MRRLTWLLLPLPALVLVRCSSFESGPAVGDSGVDAPVVAPQDDGGGAAEDASTDAALPVIACGEETCDPRVDMCCMYRNYLGQNRGECTKLSTFADCVTRDAGESAVAVSYCDDPSDCAPGLVCCHSYDYDKSCGIVPTLGACISPQNCHSCVQDAGTGWLPCDPEKPPEPQCHGLRCVTRPVTTAIIAKAYCTP